MNKTILYWCKSTTGSYFKFLCSPSSDPLKTIHKLFDPEQRETWKYGEVCNQTNHMETPDKM